MGPLVWTSDPSKEGWVPDDLKHKKTCIIILKLASGNTSTLCIQHMFQADQYNIGV